MSASSASASTPAYPPPTTMNVSSRRRSAGSIVVSAASSRDSTWLRRKMASPMVLNAMPCSASPGIGSVRATEPGATTSTSKPSAVTWPSASSTVTSRSALLIDVTRPVSTWHLRSTRRSGTTTWRGSMEPAAASGRNGW